MAASEASLDSGGLGAAPDGPAPQDRLAVERRMLQAIEGTEAVLEGRRSVEAARAELPTAAPAPASAPSRSADQPLNFFEHSKKISQLEAQLHVANQRIREADAQVKSALLLVAAEQSNVTRAEARLAEAEAAVDAAREPQLLAQEAAAEIREALAMQRGKRQRLADGQSASADAADAEAAPTPAAAIEAPPCADIYKEYSLDRDF